MGGNYSSLLLLVGLFAVMYFLMIRPQQKREKETKAMRDSVKVGDEIITIGGVIGKVIKVSEDRITIVTGGERTRLDFSKWAVQAINGYVKGSSKRSEPEAETEKGKPSPKSIKKLGEKPIEAEPEEATAEALGETPKTE